MKVILGYTGGNKSGIKCGTLFARTEPEGRGFERKGPNHKKGKFGLATRVYLKRVTKGY